MVELQLPKLVARVRFPSLALLRGRARPVRIAQAGYDLGVRGLLEVVVPLADGEERFGSLQGDEPVGLVRQALLPVGWCDGDRDHHLGGTELPGGAAGRDRSGASRDAVVRDDGALARQIEATGTRPELVRPPGEFGSLTRLHLGQLRFADAHHPHRCRVDDAHAVLANRAHRILRMPSTAELAHHDHVERRLECARDLMPHRHTAAGKAEHDGVAPAQLQQDLREAPSGIRSVCEHAFSPPPPVSACAATEQRSSERAPQALGVRGRSVVPDAGRRSVKRTHHPSFTRKEEAMPASKEMPSTLERSPKHAQAIWSKAHDSAVDEYGEGERAHRTAYAALKHEYEKVGDHWEKKEQAGPSDEGGRG